MKNKSNSKIFFIASNVISQTEFMSILGPKKIKAICNEFKKKLLASVL